MTLRGLLIFGLLFAMIVFMMPFIMGFVFIIVISVAILMLLARFGFFKGRGRTYRTYTYTTGRTSGGPRPKSSRPFEEPIRAPDDGEDEVWYQSTQEGEMITLPETALKKEDEE